MVNTRTLQLSFNAGEVSQELYGRIDLKDHQSGLKKCLNMYVKPQGAAKRRPGLQYVGNARSNSLKSRLIPFNSPTPMVLELTQNHMRFYRNGEAIALTGDNYFVARSCTLNTLTGVWTLASGNLDNLANDARVTVYSTTAAGPGALFTDASQGPARIRLIAQSNEWSVTDVAPVVVTQSAHGLRQNDSVVFRESGSSLRWYYVEVIDEFRFKPKIGSVVSPPLSPQQLQDLKLTPKTLFACVTPAPTIALSAHYFIDKLSSTTFRLKTSVGGLPITAYDNAGIGTFTLSAYYAQGSLIFDQGLGNYYQTNGAIFSSSSATATWVNYAINNASATTWSLQATGQGLAHNNNYSDAELMELTYAQDNNRLTIAHRNRPTIILTRTTDLQWSWSTQATRLRWRLLPTLLGQRTGRFAIG
jgi:hypothetical protein